MWPPKLATVAGALVVVCGGLFVGLDPLGDNSFLTHLATGQLILDDGIPRHDVYSFTAPGHPWVVQSWLASTIYAGLERAWGGDAIVLLVGLSCAAVAAGVWSLTRPANTLIPRVVIAGLVMGGTAGYLIERPLLFGLMGLVLALLAAEGRLAPVWLLPIGWVWVNTHGSFPIGLVAVALLAGGRRLDGESAAVELRALRWLAGGVALGAVNPLGPRLLWFPVELLSRNEQLRAIAEWQAPRFTETSERMFLVVVAVAIVALTRRPSWRAALPLALFVVAALLSARNIPVALLVLVPGLARGLADLGSIRGEERRPASAFAIGAVGVLAALLVVDTAGEPAFNFAKYPVAAVDWLEAEHDLKHSERRLVTQDFVGNYLELRYGTDVLTFIDDRYDMYPAAVIDDYRRLLRGGAGWDEVLDDREADAVLWDVDLPLAQLLDESDGWDVVYEDDDWLVAVETR